MSQRIECPHCHAPYAYSPAIRGRRYNCTQCQQFFTVASEFIATLGLLGSESHAIASLMPPPLPVPVTPVSTGPSSDSARKPRQSIAPRPERSSGVVALFGLIASFLVGFSIIATGIGYLLWPSSASDNIPSTPTTAIPTELPADVEKPKNLNEILKEPPPGGVPKQKPNPFPNPGFNGPLPVDPLVPQPLPPRKFGPR